MGGGGTPSTGSGAGRGECFGEGTPTAKQQHTLTLPPEPRWRGQLSARGSLYASLKTSNWRVLEQMHHAGHLRAIGVSNYTLGHLQELLAHCRVPPAVLQVEFHPELPQRELWDFCQQHGIHLQAYASLGCGQLLGRAEVGRVAERQGRTPAQVLLRWALHQGVGVIPKSVSPTRLAENAQLWDWDLSPEDMAELGTMDCSRHYCWDPSGVT
uniref:NADP-dependent oxidoreductase domain-containing protein n=1 Tax=Chelonoidis abingdonii TaxID=106734 RepID=A0A8C0G270_CHEAB